MFFVLPNISIVNHSEDFTRNKKSLQPYARKWQDESREQREEIVSKQIMKAEGEVVALPRIKRGALKAIPHLLQKVAGQ